ncbi:MAG: 2-oxoglutarate dehydrogenase complex dihydrolipoyllysine-residue succinyltransferase [Methylococcales bacterium]|nr:2-oxoglutarate dehydrogenase complex dihydrolipoyllysine-residue succinyltransferase [Methylococcales bacterium]MBT7408227.1 2-oxoglutarate dehydrogenase complex dihydrolipoyllysine-residue succinyltransferase [Methylococcales bacterium]
MSIEVLVPSLPESVADATIVTWHKKVGEQVSRDENLVDLETDKVVLEVPAPIDGVITKILQQDGDVVTSGVVLAILESASDQPVVSSEAVEQNTAQNEVMMSPAVRRMVTEHKLNESLIPATGKGGRLIKADVINYLETQKQTKEPSVGTPVIAEPKIEASIMSQRNPVMSNVSLGERKQQRVPMTRLRARVAERLVEAQQTSAILTTFNEVDLKAVMDMRKHYKESFEKEHDIKLGVMSFFVKASIDALKRYPIINASVDGNDIIYHDYFDIGIAVSSPRGLVVPILRETEKLSFAEIEKGILGYAEQAKNGSLSYEALMGGTFTISNGGVFGSMLSTPILNPPQSAILGMHTIQQRAVVVNGEIVIRPMMYLALSYDHRIVDGRDAVQFLVRIKENLQDPGRMLLDV